MRADPRPTRAARRAALPWGPAAWLALLLLLAPACGDDEPAADEPPPWAAILSRAEGFYDRGDHDQSAALYAECAAAAEAYGDARQATAFRAQQGVCLKMAGHPEQARTLLEPALASARASGDQRTEGLALGNLARIEELAGDDAAALAYMDELVAFAERVEDPRLAVQTLEQAAMFSLDQGDVGGALARLDQALERNAEVPAEEDRRDALLRQRASVLVRQRDDAGALRLWAAVPPVASARANQALHLASLGLHGAAADRAREAAALFEQEGGLRRGQRDEALYLALSEQLLAGDPGAVRGQLDQLLAGGGDPRALAPFRLLAARAALLTGDGPGALEAARRARVDLDDAALDEQAGWLEVLALGRQGEHDAAHAALDGLPSSLARGVLRGWLLAAVPREDSLATSLVPELALDVDPSGDRSLEALSRLSPEALPDPAWLALHLHLADAERHRAADRTALADALVQDGARAALTWQLRLARRRVLGDWAAEADLAGERATIEAWVTGRLPPTRGIVAVLPGARLSYEVICTSGLGATTFGLPGAADLAERSGTVVETLKAGDLGAVLTAARRLFTTLFGTRALVDLRGRDEWVLLLPAELTAVPPALLVTADPRPGQPVSWLVRRARTRLLPHAPAAAAAPDAGRQGWWFVGEAQVPGSPEDPLRAGLLSRYGAGAIDVGPLRGGAPEELSLRAEAATASGLRRVAARAGVLELSVPGLGGGRTAGLMLSPDPSASFGDESLGLLPWHRLAELSLPPLLILDRTRFDPADTEHGPPYAAACALGGGARWVLMNRWPMAAPMREGLLATLSQGLSIGMPFDLALAEAQRGYLDAAGDGPGSHPLQWAAPLLFGGE